MCFDLPMQQMPYYMQYLRKKKGMKFPLDKHRRKEM